jgi:hypothetical protein
MSDWQNLENIANELIKVYDIRSAPVPVESMLQHPLDDMWDEIDISKLSGSFINVKDYYSPRMSLARLLVRHVVSSPWGQERDLASIRKDEEAMRAFARMLMMPSQMVMALSPSSRTPERLSIHFEVPLDDAEMRLRDLGI